MRGRLAAASAGPTRLTLVPCWGALSSQGGTRLRHRLRMPIDTVGVDWVAFRTDCPADIAIQRAVSELGTGKSHPRRKETILWKNLERLLTLQRPG